MCSWHLGMASKTKFIIGDDVCAKSMNAEKRIQELERRVAYLEFKIETLSAQQPAPVWGFQNSNMVCSLCQKNERDCLCVRAC